MNAMRRYIRVVDGFNYGLGRIMMYGIFVLMGILLWSSYNKTFASPQIWTLEMAQFVMVGYYILGGPYALQMGANVRMDLFPAQEGLDGLYHRLFPADLSGDPAVGRYRIHDVFVQIRGGAQPDRVAPLYVAGQSDHVHRHHPDAASSCL